MFKELSTFSKLIFSLLIVVFSTTVFFFVGALLAIPLFNVNYFVNPELIMPVAGGDMAVAKFFQMVNSIGLFVIPPLIIAALFFNGALSGLRLNKRPLLLPMVMVVFAVLVALPVIDGLALFNANLALPDSMKGIEDWMREKEDLAAELTASLLQMDTFGQFMVNLLMIAMIPAIGEELLFRGVFQKLLIKLFGNVHVAIFVTAFLFSAFHMQFYGFLPRLFLGLFLGYLFVWSKNMWLPILAHFLNNGFAVGYYYAMDVNVEEVGNTSDIPFTYATFVGAAAVFMVLCYYIRQQYKARELVVRE